MSALRRWVAAGAVTFLACLAPAGAAAQCAMDMIESGIEAYRGLSLEPATELLTAALALNAESAGTCQTENATALVYMGASYWLLDQRDEARASFERAVVQAPRVRPDPLEFPPEISEAFQSVRRSTPSVAVEMARETVVGPGGADQLEVRLTASTSHSLTARILNSRGDMLRTLFGGMVDEGPDGIRVTWDGRDPSGEPVPTGSYELEVVSSDTSGTPVRKVVTTLDVVSDAPATDAFRTEVPMSGARERTRSGGWGRAVTALGVGLAGGALVIVVPELVEDAPASKVRYGIAGSVGIAGIVGFVKQLWGEDDEDSRAPMSPSPRVGDVPENDEPTLRIRPGLQRRIELDETETAGPEGAAGATDGVDR